MGLSFGRRICWFNCAANGAILFGMSDTSTIETSAPPKRRKGPGAGKPAPEVVLNGSNIGTFFEGEQPRRRRGRPSSYTLQRGKRICAELILGP
jgi:hypothetical protein